MLTSAQDSENIDHTVITNGGWELHREFLKSEKSQVSRVGRCHKTRCWRIISWLILDSDEDAGGQLFLDFKLKNFILFDNRKISYFNLHPFFKNDGFFTVGSMRKLTILKRNSMKVEIQTSEKFNCLYLKNKRWVFFQHNEMESNPQIYFKRFSVRISSCTNISFL